MKELTPKQEMFCQVYVSTGNATEAYRQAYDTSNMKYATIIDCAAKLKTNPHITHRIEVLEAERAKQYNAENIKAKVIEVCSDITNADVTDMFEADDETGEVKMRNIKQMPKELRASIKRIINNNGKLSFEFYDKVAAGDRLAKMFGFDVPNRQEIDFNGGGFDVQIKQ